MNKYDVEITVRDDKLDVVLSITLYERTQDEIDNQVLSLKSVFVLCDVIVTKER